MCGSGQGSLEFGKVHRQSHAQRACHAARPAPIDQSATKISTRRSAARPSTSSSRRPGALRIVQDPPDGERRNSASFWARTSLRSDVPGRRRLVSLSGSFWLNTSTRRPLSRGRPDIARASDADAEGVITHVPASKMSVPAISTRRVAIPADEAETGSGTSPAATAVDDSTGLGDAEAAAGAAVGAGCEDDVTGAVGEEVGGVMVDGAGDGLDGAAASVAGPSETAPRVSRADAGTSGRIGRSVEPKSGDVSASSSAVVGARDVGASHPTSPASITHAPRAACGIGPGLVLSLPVSTPRLPCRTGSIRRTPSDSPRDPTARRLERRRSSVRGQTSGLSRRGLPPAHRPGPWGEAAQSVPHPVRRHIRTAAFQMICVASDELRPLDHPPNAFRGVVRSGDRKVPDTL